MADHRKHLQEFAKSIANLKKTNLNKPKFKVVKSKFSDNEQNIRDNSPSTSGINKQINLVSQQPSTSSMEMDSSPQPSSSQSNNSAKDINFIYETNDLKAFIERGIHKQEKKFALHDHLFYIKVQPKNNTYPLINDILDFIEIACNYILNEIKELYKVEDNNIAYMTIYQEPMVNGINSGPFHIQDSSTEMTNRLLGMFNQYLISNQELRLNQTFKIYLKILSIEHMNENKTKIKRVVKRKHYGSKDIKDNVKMFYVIDIPNGFKNHDNCFKNKCLITSIILGVFQNLYYKSSRMDKRYIYAQKVNSKLEKKKIMLAL